MRGSDRGWRVCSRSNVQKCNPSLAHDIKGLGGLTILMVSSSYFQLSFETHLKPRCHPIVDPLLPCWYPNSQCGNIGGSFIYPRSWSRRSRWPIHSPQSNHRITDSCWRRSTGTRRTPRFFREARDGTASSAIRITGRKASSLRSLQQAPDGDRRWVTV